MLLLSGGAVRPQQKETAPPPPKSGAITLPKNALLPATTFYRLWNGLIVIEAPVNGKDSVGFVLDTGLNVNAFDPAAGQGLQVTALNKPVRVDAVHSRGEGSEGQLKSLRIGALILDNVPVALLNFSALLSNTPHPDAPPGWLGWPFLSAFQVTIDFGSRSVVLNPPQDPLPSTRGTTIVPIKVREGHIWVKVTIPGARTFDALVDTGTVGTLLPGDVGDKLKLKPLDTMVIHTKGKEGKANLIQVPQIRVGKAEVKQADAVYLAAGTPAGLDRNLGILGIDFLSHFRVTIDYAKQKMALAPLLPTAVTPPAATDDQTPPQAD